MDMDRRNFIAGLVATGTLGTMTAPRNVPPPARQTAPPDRFDPWIEVDPRALDHNVGVVSRLAGGRPILAVIKNNAYGLGLVEAARVLEARDEVEGFAVVKAAAALKLKEAGIRKPVLLMAQFTDEEGPELLARGVELALTSDDSAPRAMAAAERAGAPLHTQLYLDTGMSRMGIPHHRIGGWLDEYGTLELGLRGTFTALTEDEDFDTEQLARFRSVTDRARERGVALGRLHAASSNGVFHLPTGHLDQVRPGIALFGAYPSYPEREAAIAELRCAVRLKARVVRTERLRSGDGVSYGRNYVAESPTWIATIPAGHTDGIARGSVNGARVLIGDRTYPVIGAVSASHTVVEVGAEPTVRIGDVATLLGPDHPAILPNTVAQASGSSVYDRLMHLSPSLPRIVTG